jgi:indole-3-glycerol phosphate synthase
MNLHLQAILARAEAESEYRRQRDSLKKIKQAVKDVARPRGFFAHIKARPFSVIAETKIKSPSNGKMGGITEERAQRIADNVHKIYEDHPIVSAISVLTQHADFGGSDARLRMIHRQTRKPILRKDFIQSEYEVYYSRFIGADAILLMANVVTDSGKFAELHDLAVGLGMDVLCEVHTEQELQTLPSNAKIYGINSRSFANDSGFNKSKYTRHLDVQDVTTDLKTFGLFGKLPTMGLRIAESGMTEENIETVLEKYPFDAALIGTSILKKGLEGARQVLDQIQSAAERVLGGSRYEEKAPQHERELATV